MTDRVLTDKVALVLGATGGIGKGIGLALAGEGAMVALNYHDWPERLPDLERDIARTRAPHLIIRTNLLETDRVKGLVRRVVDHFGRIDILVNNIERGGWPVVHGPYTRQQWDLEMETTLRAKRWVFAEALPHLKATGNGVVINLSSIAGIVGRCGPAGLVFNDGYAAANRGISLLTETWARCGAPEVRVNEIVLGFIESRHGRNTRGWGLLSSRQKKAIVAHTLLHRIGAIEDVVRAVLFVIREAPFMTGARLRIDGGYVLGGEPVPPMPEGVV
jgi:3-oxoacyl-[acyl-carrier protein] reductase